MPRVHPLVGTAVVFVAAPLVASIIASLAAGIAGMILGFYPMAASFWGSLAITPLLWFWFIRWNLRD
jgi:uncharacterized membrane protein